MYNGLQNILIDSPWYCNYGLLENHSNTVSPFTLCPNHEELQLKLFVLLIRDDDNASLKKIFHQNNSFYFLFCALHYVFWGDIKPPWDVLTIITLQDSVSSHKFSPEVEMALAGVQFIAQHIRNNDKDNEVMEDWKYIAMVLDRLFLLLFTLTCFAGSGGIILRAPSLYDMREPIDAKYTTIGV